MTKRKAETAPAKPEFRNIVEEYVATKAQRLQMQKLTDALEVKEKQLKESIIQALRNKDLKPLGEAASKVTLSSKDKPTVSDWPKVYDFIYANHAIDLLQKRLTETAVKLRWDDNISIPGVDKFPVYDISVTGVILT